MRLLVISASSQSAVLDIDPMARALIENNIGVHDNKQRHHWHMRARV